MKYKGLAEFGIALKHASVDRMLEEAMEMSCDPMYDCIGPQNSWPRFRWAFGNVWRNYYRKGVTTAYDVAATFPICRVLTKDALERVAITVGITDPYKPETYR